jgi:lysine/ornithine N-monooxygenase
LKQRDTVFFADPRWLPEGYEGQKCLETFLQEPDLKKRSEKLRKEHLPLDTIDQYRYKALYQACGEEKLSLMEGADILSAEYKGGKIHLKVQKPEISGCEVLEADQILLATGFVRNPKRSGLSSKWPAT